MRSPDGQWMCAGGEGKLNCLLLQIVYYCFLSLSFSILNFNRFQLNSIIGRDVCAGFGGAPLVIKENGVYLQIGIMSFGSDNCGGRNIPSVYTSIAYFIPWIRENSPVE